MLTIIILNWNGWKDTIVCLNSIFGQTYENYHVIIVDNGSTDDSVEKIKDFFSVRKIRINLSDCNSNPEDEDKDIKKDLRFSLINTNKNLGYARGNNCGIRYAFKHFRPDFILVMNNDVILPDPETLSKLINYAENNPKIGVLAPVIVSPDGKIQRSFKSNLPNFLDMIFVYTSIGQRLFPENRFWKKHFLNNFDFKSPEEVAILSGSFMVFRASALKEIGFYDEGTFLYWEEDIVGKKFTDAGWKSVIFPNVKVIHKGETSITTYHLKSMSRYWSIQSEFYFINKYLDLSKLQKCFIKSIYLIESLLAIALTYINHEKFVFDRDIERKIIRFLILDDKSGIIGENSH